jgi:hypothetical protein
MRKRRGRGRAKTPAQIAEGISQKADELEYKITTGRKHMPGAGRPKKTELKIEY